MRKLRIILASMAYIAILFFGCSDNNNPSSGNNDSSSSYDGSSSNGNSSSSKEEPPMVCVGEDYTEPVGSGEGGATNTGACIEPPGRVPPNGKETCITVGGKCYICNPERGDECLAEWLWERPQVEQEYWWKDVTATACSGGGTVTNLTCSGFSSAAFVGAAVTKPTVKCGNSIVTTGIEWAPEFNWASPAKGCYNVTVKATAGDCNGKKASCGKLIVNSAQTNPSSSSGGGIAPSPSSSSGVENAPYPPLQQGQSGVQSGWTSRYWDGCKQSCSWSDKQQHSPLTSNDRCKVCGKDGSSEIAANDNNKSSCDGGNSYTCFDFTPHKVNDNLAYAFAASPTDKCGKCFQIQFDGGFKHGTANETHQAVKGKTLIVMTSNMGYDVSGGQFDVLIPGGGVGAFDAFSSQIGVQKNQLGEQYGGLLSACENENNYDFTKYKSCLTNKCNIFTNATLKEGCLFYANWFEAANNPTMLYKEVNCPQYLIDKYKATLK